MQVIPVTPPQRTLTLEPTGDTSLCIVERRPNRETEQVEVRSAEEAVRLIGALVVAFGLPALPATFRA